jgi:hypothetical protein
MDAGKTNATFIWVFPIEGGGFLPDVEELFVHQQFWNLALVSYFLVFMT